MTPTALDPFLPFKLGPVTGRNAAKTGRSLIASEWIYEEQRLRFCYCCVGLANPKPNLRMASLGSSENIDRAAGHPCQGDDGYGGLQQHQHLGASGALSD